MSGTSGGPAEDCLLPREERGAELWVHGRETLPQWAAWGPGTVGATCIVQSDGLTDIVLDCAPDPGGELTEEFRVELRSGPPEVAALALPGSEWILARERSQLDGSRGAWALTSSGQERPMLIGVDGGDAVQTGAAWASRSLSLEARDCDASSGWENFFLMVDDHRVLPGETLEAGPWRIEMVEGVLDTRTCILDCVPDVRFVLAHRTE